MPLVEIIYTPKTKPEYVATALNFVKKIGKTPVVCKDGPGFVVNRILGPYLLEAGYLAVKGVPLDEVDKTLMKFGMPMGPFRLMDEVGLDVCEKASKILHSAFGDRMRPTTILESLVDRKLLGKKSGGGFYTYEGGKTKFNFDVYHFMGVSPHFVGAGDSEREKWVKILLYPMINEACRILDEKIVTEASAVDIAMIFGAGFAPFRGGLLRWADSLGLEKVLLDMEELGHELGAPERFAPCDYLKKMAKEGRQFYPT